MQCRRMANYLRWGHVSPLEEESREGAVPPPQNFFYFCVEMGRFDAFWCFFDINLFLIIKNKFRSKISSGLYQNSKVTYRFKFLSSI